MNRFGKLLGSFSRIHEVERALCLFHPGWEVFLRFLNPTRGCYPFSVTLAGTGHRVDCEDWHDLTTLWTVFTGGEYRVAEGCRAICDLGANFGAFTLWASIAAPSARIIAVEPHPGTFRRLRENLGRWGLGERVHALEAAVWTSGGEVGLDGRMDTPSHSVRVIAGEAHSSDVLTVNAVPIAELLQLLGGSCDLVKMDIEGGENRVIQSLREADADRVREWQIEYHGRECRDQVARRLLELGFHHRFEKLRDDCGVFHFSQRETATPTGR